MQSPTVADLNDRAREVFRQIVDAYLASGAPVGSRTLSKLGVEHAQPLGGSHRGNVGLPAHRSNAP